MFITIPTYPTLSSELCPRLPGLLMLSYGRGCQVHHSDSLTTYKEEMNAEFQVSFLTVFEEYSLQEHLGHHDQVLHRPR